MATWYGALPLHVGQHLETGDLWCDSEGVWFVRLENLSWEEIRSDEVSV